MVPKERALKRRLCALEYAKKTCHSRKLSRHLQSGRDPQMTAVGRELPYIELKSKANKRPLTGLKLPIEPDLMLAE